MGVGGKRRAGVNSEVILIISSIVLEFMNVTPILTHKWSDEPATLSSSESAADQQECPSRIKRTDPLLWMRKMGGTHSQTTLVFNKRGDVRLDSLSRFHLNSQWKRSVTSHDEVILSFTLKRVNIQPALLQQVRSRGL